jgi:hypothetical protein
LGKPLARNGNSKSNGNGNGNGNSQNTEITDQSEKTQICQKRYLLIRVVTV